MSCSVIVSLGLLLSATSMVDTGGETDSYIPRERHTQDIVPLQMLMMIMSQLY